MPLITHTLADPKKPSRFGAICLGGGCRVDAEPVSAYVIRGEKVEWQPVFDLSQVVNRGQLVGMVALVVLGAVLKVWRSC